MSERNKIVYGQWTFLDDDISSGNLYMAVSLMSDSLEANTFTATVECDDREIIDFQRNAPLTYYYKGAQKGIFYIQSITREGPTTYTISATSAIGLLIEGLHYGGIYTGQTVAQVLPSICGTVPYVVKTSLRDIALYGWLPVATPRDNLSQVLFAIGATVKTDLDGVLHIEGLWDGISGTLPRDSMYQGPSVDYEAKVTQVVVTEHQYIEGGEQTDLFDGTAQSGDIITFDEPMYNLQATGFTILESGANYAKVSAGSGTLTGNAYVHNTRQVAVDVLEANEPNVVTVTDATLVSLVNSLAVAQRVANYYASYQTINTDAEYRGEMPGDLLSAWHPYDNEAVSACLESADIYLSGALMASETSLVGFTPIQAGEEGFVDTLEILTGSGNWTVPESVTSIRVVAIGSGQNGTAGEDGVTPDRGPTETKVDSLTGATSIKRYPVEGGAGGEPGDPGVGGKIYIEQLSVTPGQTFAYNCSASGGGDSTFGSLSSANGSSSDTGFLEIIHNEVYALPGNPGTAGGSGSGAVVSENQPPGSYWTDYDDVPGSTVTYLGVEYHPGEKGPTNSDNQTYQFLGGYGGGAAAGSNGGDGYWSTGGFGANAIAPAAKTTYGEGGDGGNGGGGGGSAAESMYTSRTGTPSTPDPVPGSGGSGSAGGLGGPGCVIVYYSLPKVVQAGSFVTSDGKYFVDANGRRLVV